MPDEPWLKKNIGVTTTTPLRRPKGKGRAECAQGADGAAADATRGGDGGLESATPQLGAQRRQSPRAADRDDAEAKAVLRSSAYF